MLVVNEKMIYWLKKRSQEVILTTMGILLLISVLILILATSVSRSSILLIPFFFISFIIYFISIELVRRFSISTTKRNLFIIILIPSLILLLLLTTSISLSDDIYRFIIEGKMIVNGLNPYQTPINSVNGLSPTSYLAKVNNSSVTSPYPPLILLFFAFLNLLTSDVIIFRVSFSFAFIFSIFLLNSLLPAEMSWKLIIYAWNPLILLETGNGLHFETLIIAILMISLFSLENDRPTTAALGFLIAFFLKYYSIFPIILFWKHFQRKGQLLISIGLGSYLGAVFLDPTLISGLLTYANDWNFNSSIFGVVNEFISIPFVSKLILAVIFLFLLVFYSQKAFQEEKLPHNYTIIVLGTLILFQPTFHPWYLLWLFPFLLLDRESIIWSWILLSGTIILSYSVHVSYDIVGFWKEPLFFRLLEYLPFYALLIYETRNSLKIVFSKIRYQLFEKIKIFPPFSFR